MWEIQKLLATDFGPALVVAATWRVEPVGGSSLSLFCNSIFQINKIHVFFKRFLLLSASAAFIGLFKIAAHLNNRLMESSLLLKDYTIVTIWGKSVGRCDVFRKESNSTELHHKIQNKIKKKKRKWYDWPFHHSLCKQKPRGQKKIRTGRSLD